MSVINSVNAIFACAVLMVCGVTAHAQALSERYRITDLGTLSVDIFGGGPHPIGLNDHGQVVGSLFVPGGVGSSHEWRAVVIDGPNRRILPRIPGYKDCFGVGISNDGTVAGYGENSGYGQPEERRQGAYLWSGQDTLPLAGIAGDPYVVVQAMNRRGDAVGYSQSATGDSESMHAILWRKGKPPVVLGSLGGTQSMPEALNDSGQVIGYSEVPDPRPIRDDRPFPTLHAVVWSSGTLRDLGGRRGDNSVIATGVNNRGDIVGYAENEYSNTPNVHAFLCRGGHLHWFGSGMPQAIDDVGNIVGSARGHAVMWRRGKPHNLQSRTIGAQGWRLIEASTINARGQIVGFGILHGKNHAYLLTPVNSNARK